MWIGKGNATEHGRVLHSSSVVRLDIMGLPFLVGAVVDWEGGEKSKRWGLLVPFPLVGRSNKRSYVSYIAFSRLRTAF